MMDLAKLSLRVLLAACLAGCSTTETEADLSGGGDAVNRALYAYLGHPVPLPVDVDPAYSREAMAKALRAGARKAGIDLPMAMLDDSEFPPLAGGLMVGEGEVIGPKVLFDGMDSDKYEWSGSYTSSTADEGNWKKAFVIDIVPKRAIPGDLHSMIRRRKSLRIAKLLDEIKAVW